MGVGHGEVEPVKIGLNGVIKEPEQLRPETLSNRAPVRVPEGIEGEGHVGVIVEF